MTSKETLKQWCKDCEYTLSLAKTRCPFRSISNDYCDEYNDLLKDLTVLEIIKEKLMWVENDKIYIGLQNDTYIELTEEDFNYDDRYIILKEWLEYGK